MSRLRLQWTGSEWVDWPGVNVSVVQGLDGISWLDPDNALTKHETQYYASFIESAIAVGYVEGVSMVGMPYDWRHGGGGSMIQWRADLVGVVEALVESAGMPLVLVSHSMGCLEVSLFLQLQSAAWKAKHIWNWVCAGGPMIGAPKVAKGVLTGDNLGIVTLPTADAFILQSNSATGFFLLPTTDAWPSPVVYGGNTSYWATDLPALFAKRGQGAFVKHEQPWLQMVLRDPGVNVTLIAGSGTPTAGSIMYQTASLTGTPTLYNVDGDGTVPLVSAFYPVGRWAAVNPVQVKGVEHLQLVQTQGFFNLVMDVAAGQAPVKSH